MELTREQLEKVIRDAFNAGESWGCAHEGWFIPTADQTEEKIQETISDILD